QKRMTEVSPLAVLPACNWKKSPSPKPPTPSTPACKKLRRVSRLGSDPERTLNMAGSFDTGRSLEGISRGRVGGLVIGIAVFVGEILVAIRSSAPLADVIKHHAEQRQQKARQQERLLHPIRATSDQWMDHAHIYWERGGEVLSSSINRV